MTRLPIATDLMLLVDCGKDAFCHLYLFFQSEDSAIDNNLGPPIDLDATKNYRTMKAILQRLIRLCVTDASVGRKPRKHEQRLLRNMGAHSAILELLEIPCEKVSAGPRTSSLDLESRGLRAKCKV